MGVGSSSDDDNPSGGALPSKNSLARYHIGLAILTEKHLWALFFHQPKVEEAFSRLQKHGEEGFSICRKLLGYIGVQLDDKYIANIKSILQDKYLNHFVAGTVVFYRQVTNNNVTKRKAKIVEVDRLSHWCKVKFILEDGSMSDHSMEVFFRNLDLETF